jgi:hypothetical protein
MGMAIDEARHHDPARRVYFHRVADRREVFHAARWPRLAQYAFGDENRPSAITPGRSNRFRNVVFSSRAASTAV